MFRKIRESKAAKFLAVFIVLNLFLDLFAPSLAKALTGGPSQPEVQSFEPVGTDQMVDPFTGDFTYNVPLLDVGGYPINLSYHSGITMEQEASWVGLGWNVNPGVINRNMRGVPDDFNGDLIETQYSLKPNVTYGVRGVLGVELFGLELDGSAGLGINYNTYRGIGMQTIVNVGISGGDGSKPAMCANLGLTGGSEGLSISGDLSYAKKIKGEDETYSIGVGSTFSSTEGLKDVSFDIEYANELGKDGLKFLKKENVGIADFKTGHSISFNSSSYTPALEMPMNNSSISFACKLGIQALGTDAWLNISGYYSRQELYRNEENGSAYGYLYSINGEHDEKALLDFNREKDGSYTREKPVLPLAYMTYDIYSVSGQGIGGVYRPFSCSVGQVYDPKVNNYGEGGSLGGEIAGLSIVKGGIDIAVNYTQSKSHKWEKNNNLSDLLLFGNYYNGSNLSTPYYFREVGETSIESDEDYINALGGRNVVTPGIVGEGYKFSVQSSLYDKNGNSLGSSSIRRNAQAKRNQLIVPLNAEQATYYGIEKNINYYTYNGGQYTPGSTGRISGARLDHHISEVTTLRPDGMRYVYGIPAYNLWQKEVAFSCDGLKFGNQYVFYTDGVDNIAPNNKGRDHYHKSTTMPGYAYAYLLTAILSPDYVDCDGIDGPSEGDLGTYTKLSYVKVDNYEWKSPYDKPGEIGSMAILNEGIREDKEDDKATYVQGNKELWFLHKVETKTQVANFYISDQNRTDACSNGDMNKNMRLDSIRLFSCVDYNQLHEDATPIKAVHFVYSQELCPGVWNTTDGVNSGKLTLKEIYFTYGKSYKGELNKYQFDYSTINPRYNPMAFDRWGNYQEFETALPNYEFPYTTQIETDANDNAAAWSLTKIELPSGGAIEVNYEADDYAFVMHKRAKEMIKIDGFNSSQTYSTDNALYNGLDPNNYVFFTKDPTVNIDEYFKDQNGKVDSVLFYRCDVQMKPNSFYYETISGYAKIEAYYDHGSFGCIKLAAIDIGDREEADRPVNPISKAAWQFGQLNMNHLMHSSPNGSQTEDIILSLVTGGIGTDVITAFRGENRVYRDANRGKFVELGHSFIRLNDPKWSKNGGGSRVHTITINDNWNSMSGEGEFSYGQIYDYTTTNNFANNNVQIISSGVASYEPNLGGEENPYKMPIGYINKRKWVADRDFYVEHPIGESFIPVATVGYSRVTVSNLKHPGVTRHATGKTVYEFYTAYDFPVYIDYTTKFHIEKKPSLIANLFKLNVKDNVAASQGFYIETNDMHGKPKSQCVYAEGENTPISAIKYYYKTLPDNSQRLDTRINAVDASGEIQQKFISMDMDLTIDSREQKSETYSAALGGNIASFLLGCIPGIAPTIIPSYSCEKTKFNSITATKVVNCFGIQDSVVAYDLGSRVATKNILYDGETGSPVLTKISNEFNDPIYNFTYPAHWMYEGMGPAYKNTLVGVFYEGNIVNGVANVPSANTIFFPGDEIDIYSSLSHIKGWVGEVNTNSIKIINQGGELINVYATNMYIRVMRSGRRNLQSVPVGSVSLLKSPIVGGYLEINSGSRVINAEATEYSDVWQMPGPAGPCEIEMPCSDCSYSDEGFLAFMNMIKGNIVGVNVELKSLPYCTFGQKEPDHALCHGTYAGTTTGNYLNWQLTNCDPYSSISGTELLEMVTPVGFDWNQIESFDEMSGSDIYFSYYDINHVLHSDGVISHVSTSYLPYFCPKPENEFQCFNGYYGTHLPIVNPFYHGLRGVWRPKKTYKYLTGRVQTTNIQSNKNIRDDGYFNTFSPFWYQPIPGTDSWVADITNVDWVFTSEVSKFNTMSAELENKDALQRYTAAQYGYSELLPVAIGNNIMYKEIGFYGFENDKSLKDCPILHFNFDNPYTWINDNDAHTGWFSLEIPGNRQADMVRCMTPKFPVQPSVYNCPFQTNSADFLGLFSPHSNYQFEQKFVVSFWAKPSNASGIMTDYSGISAQFYAGSSALAILSLKKSKLVEGWQQYEYLISIDPMVDGNFILSLMNQNSVPCYYDDVRIFPFKSNIKCYVYNNQDHKLMAELDENNYATFYEYDQEGKLIRVKRETERGIFTIQQSINHQHSNY